MMATSSTFHLPHILEIRPRENPSGPPMEFVWVQQSDSEVRTLDGDLASAATKLTYKDLSCSGWASSGSIEAWYSARPEVLSLTGGGFFINSNKLQGKGLGTYLLCRVVHWARQWPKAEIAPITLARAQATPDNRHRRNRLYERLGITFNYLDGEQAEATSWPIQVENLVAIDSWQRTITETPADEFCMRLLAARASDAHEITSLQNAVRDWQRERNRWPVSWIVRALPPRTSD